jgi:predicted amidohydrolase
MSRFVNVGSLQFLTKATHGTPEAREIVLNELDLALDSAKGYGLDLLVTCEGVESYAQTVDTAESTDKPGEVLKRYQAFAKAEKCHVAGSVKLRENGKVYNSVAFINRAGKILGAYHKANLTWGEIDNGLSSGQGAVVVETDLGRLGGIVCFDLNFEWLRHKYRELKPDILCFASMYHGGLMQGMWAYDCQSYFVSALQFNGTGIVDPFGREVAVTNCYTVFPRARINLDRVMIHLDYNREKFAMIERKYPGKVKIDVPANIGSALLTSECEEFSAMDIVREFDLMLLDDYFAESIRRNAANRK